MKINLNDLEISSFTSIVSKDSQGKIIAGMRAATDYTGVGCACNATSDTANASTGVTCPDTMQTKSPACVKR